MISGQHPFLPSWRAAIRCHDLDHCVWPRFSPIPPNMRIYKDFQFEAAHFLPTATVGTANARVHGHSFRTRIVIEGEPHPDTGYIFHFDDITAALSETQDALDHRLLNEVDGLAAPTLERIAIWIWHRLANKVPGLAEVQVSRDSCQEGCIYTGPART